MRLLPFSPAVRRAALQHTIPVLMGYLTMGFAAGVVLSANKIVRPVAFWAFLSSATAISGTLQFMMAGWLQNVTPLAEILVATFCLNLRYATYGLSLLKRFEGLPLWKKCYLIWTITDETYALQVQNHTPEGHDPVEYCLAVAFFDHLYWVVGVVAGALAGAALPFDTRGINFTMTALFWVILTDQCRDRKNRRPALIGGGAALLMELVMPKSAILIGSLTLIVVSFLYLRTGAAFLRLQKRQKRNRES